MTTYKDGHHSYGQPVGILMLDTLFPRIPGEIGHAATFPFPVIHKVVHGASPKRVVLEGDPSLVEPFVTAARELEEMGVRAITTSCGFLALFHRQIAETIRVPFIASSLMQVPLVSRMVGGKPVGILTARRSALTERHFAGVGWSSKDFPVVVQGMDEAPLFSRARQENRLTIDFDQMRQEVVEAACQMVEEHPDIAAVVLECTNLPPYSADIQQALDRPVFSIVTLAKMVYAALELPLLGAHMNEMRSAAIFTGIGGGQSGS